MLSEGFFPQDPARQLVEIALGAARMAVSPQTGFVHLNYRIQDYPNSDTIPFHENLLFSLALLRQRSREGVEEARILLQKLLAFQLKEGGLPRYLHEYPLAPPLKIALDISLALAMILRDFAQLLGQRLAQELELLLKASLQRLSSSRSDLPRLHSILFFLLQQSVACTLNIDLSSSPAEETTLENDLKAIAEGSFDLSMEQLEEFIIYLRFRERSLSRSTMWEFFWRRLCFYWQRQACSLIAPFEQYPHDRFEPKVTVIDLLMGLYAGSFSNRALLNRPQLIGAIRIDPAPENFVRPPLPHIEQSSFGGLTWSVIHEEGWGCTVVKEVYKKKGRFIPFRLVWGNANRTHSLMIWSDGELSLQTTREQRRIQFSMEFSREEGSSSKELSNIFSLAVDDHEELKFLFSGKAATLFSPKEPIEIALGRAKIDLLLHIEGESKEYSGHLSKGNRPGMETQVGQEAFMAFDRILSLRRKISTWKNPVKLKLSLQLSFW